MWLLNLVKFCIRISRSVDMTPWAASQFSISTTYFPHHRNAETPIYITPTDVSLLDLITNLTEIRIEKKVVTSVQDVTVVSVVSALLHRYVVTQDSGSFFALWPVPFTTRNLCLCYSINIYLKFKLFNKKKTLFGPRDNVIFRGIACPGFRVE